MAKRRVAQHTTLLVIGEGADDQAFINHMKGLYCPRGCGRSAKIEAGDGGSPGNIITTAIRAFKGVDYDRRFLVLDSDIPPSAAEVKQARSAGYQIILWSPQCLEGALLEVLGERVGEHETSQGLKARLHPRLAGAHTAVAAYAPLFPQAVLDVATNGSVVAVRRLLLGNEPAPYRRSALIKKLI